jgi:DNA repair exonuclease SbcCD ATPase subunit
VGLDTQKQLQYHITNISSLALDSVFSDPYKLQLDFVERRGKTECDILFERNGSTIKPKDSSGYGTLDVASLALRIACWSMQMPRTNRIMIIDEPFRNLSKDNEEATSLMLKELSSKLGIQLIIISHSEILATYADKVFKLKKDKQGITKII